MKKFFSNRNNIFDLLSIFGFIYSLIAGFLIFARIDQDASLLNGFFNTKISFADLNSNIDLFFSKIFNFSFVKDKDQAVDEKIHYIELQDHTFTSDDQTVRMLKAGVIAYAVQEIDKSYSVVVKYGEIEASYFGLSALSVQALDHLKQNEVIGEHSGEFRAYFRQDGEEKKYSELFVSD